VDPKQFAGTLLKWYKINKRDLPWRETNDPYQIWLSEIILQQTRVNQGLPYFIKFMKAFPDIQALARAKEQKVLSLWQGLGYYSRARNLHHSAKMLVEQNNGMLPDTYKGLLKVKGIGKYTAAAIASFAYKEKTPVVDGNVFRVLTRVFGISSDISGSKGISEVYSLAEKIIPEREHDTYNQAIMEFGALHCLPVSPQCSSCPLSKICFAFAHQMQGDLPVKTKKIKKTTRYFNYLCLRHKNDFLMKERTGKDIWKGLFEVPMVEAKNIKSKDELLKEFNEKKIIIDKKSKTFKHVLTHQTIFAKFYVIEVPDLKYFNNMQRTLASVIYNKKQLKTLPKPVLINNFLEEYIF